MTKLSVITVRFYQRTFKSTLEDLSRNQIISIEILQRILPVIYPKLPLKNSPIFLLNFSEMSSCIAFSTLYLKIMFKYLSMQPFWWLKEEHCNSIVILMQHYFVLLLLCFHCHHILGLFFIFVKYWDSFRLYRFRFLYESL